MSIGASCPDGHGFYDRNCIACAEEYIRQLRRDLGSVRAAMRDIAEMSRDGSELGHNNYVAIFQAAKAVIDGCVVDAVTDAVDAEREACAQVVLNMDPTNGALRVLAQRIRARGQR